MTLESTLEGLTTAGLDVRATYAAGEWSIEIDAYSKVSKKEWSKALIAALDDAITQHQSAVDSFALELAAMNTAATALKAGNG